MIFTSQEVLVMKFSKEYLLNNKVEMENMVRNAYITLKEKWSPRIAAQNFMKVVEYIQNNRLDQMPIYEGPCSLDK